MKKLKPHVWLLSEEAIGFSFFDDSTTGTLKDKRMMVQALVKPGSNLPSKQVNLSDQDIKTKKFSDFITKSTKKFLDILGILTNFLEKSIYNEIYHHLLQLGKLLQNFVL